MLQAPAISLTARPGQFVLLTPARNNGASLPRPMAIFDVNPKDGTVEIVYGVVGDGTRLLTEFVRGEGMTTVGPLGRPFDVPSDARRLLLVGRGIGACSLTLLARTEVARGVEVTVLLSARNRNAFIGSAFCANAGVSTIHVEDSDGSSGVHNVEALLSRQHASKPPHFIATCGSDRLLTVCRELGRRWDCPVQVSIEAHMACGLGYCHGCAAGRSGEATESPLVCTSGPVFRAL